MTTNHDYNTPRKGATDWHEPLNENFELFDVDVEVRDTDGSRGAYDPLRGAKFFATDTGAIYLGDGSQWLRVASSGENPTFDSIELDGDVTTTGAPLSVSIDGDRIFQVTPHRSVSLGSRGVTVTAPNTVAGHAQNAVGNDVVGATVAGGGAFVTDGTVERVGPNLAEGHLSTVSGGADNVSKGDESVVGGGEGNVAGSQDARLATVSGGRGNESTGDFSTIGGGRSNTASDSSSTVGGGRNNEATDFYATVAGGLDNDGSSYAAAIAGGSENEATAPRTTIGGGARNAASAESATVGGGLANGALAEYGTVGGGEKNGAQGKYAAVIGGLNNGAMAEAATVGGGRSNRAAGSNATVPGGIYNAANAEGAFAAGTEATADHAGTFVWNDGDGGEFESTGQNQFLVDAAGGVGLGTNSPETPLDVAGENNWNLDSNEGDVRVGDDDYRLCIGVSLGGAGRGTARLRAKGTDGNPKLKLGAGDTDTAAVTDSAVKPVTDGQPSLGTSGDRWSRVYAQSGTVSTSDERLKTDVTDVSDGLDAVRALRPVAYSWDADADDAPDDDGPRLGFLAQEVADVVPEAVEEPGDEDGYYGLDYDELVPVLTAAVQEQQETIDDLEAEVDDLRGELAEMKQLLVDAGVA